MSKSEGGHNYLNNEFLPNSKGKCKLGVDFVLPLPQPNKNNKSNNRNHLSATDYNATVRLKIEMPYIG